MQDTDLRGQAVDTLAIVMMPLSSNPQIFVKRFQMEVPYHNVQRRMVALTSTTP